MAQCHVPMFLSPQTTELHLPWALKAKFGALGLGQCGKKQGSTWCYGGWDVMAVDVVILIGGYTFLSDPIHEGNTWE